MNHVSRVSGTESLPGALVLSLDFELAWGARDRVGNAYRPNLVGARLAVPRILELFGEFEIGATWATVGFLFAEHHAELRDLSPSVRPRYSDPRFSPYEERIGEDEHEDPLHFAGSLIDRVHATPRQEVATHTFSHFYCREEGQDREAFRADLKAAAEIAERRGMRVRSIVFPRNQHNPDYDDLLLEAGITAYRGNPSSYAWQFGDARDSRSPLRRASRLLDGYIQLTGTGTFAWSDVPEPSGLSNVRASFPLRPYDPRVSAIEPLRRRRILESLRYAARKQHLLHLWWHPHNFGLHTDRNLRFLRVILEETERLRREEGLLSLTMAGVDDLLRTTLDTNFASQLEANHS